MELYGRALLDTGNGAHTIITRSFAERLDLIDSAGLPRMLAGSARHVTARGVVAGAEEEQWVLPRGAGPRAAGTPQAHPEEVREDWRGLRRGGAMEARRAQCVLALR